MEHAESQVPHATGGALPVLRPSAYDRVASDLAQDAMLAVEDLFEDPDWQPETSTVAAALEHGDDGGEVTDDAPWWTADQHDSQEEPQRGRADLEHALRVELAQLRVAVDEQRAAADAARQGAQDVAAALLTAGTELKAMRKVGAAERKRHKAAVQELLREAAEVDAAHAESLAALTVDRDNRIAEGRDTERRTAEAEAELEAVRAVVVEARARDQERLVLIDDLRQRESEAHAAVRAAANELAAGQTAQQKAAQRLSEDVSRLEQAVIGMEQDALVAGRAWDDERLGLLGREHGALARAAAADSAAAALREATDDLEAQRFQLQEELTALNGTIGAEREALAGAEGRARRSEREARHRADVAEGQLQAWSVASQAIQDAQHEQVVELRAELSGAQQSLALAVQTSDEQRCASEARERDLGVRAEESRLRSDRLELDLAVATTESAERAATVSQLEAHLVDLAEGAARERALAVEQGAEADEREAALEVRRHEAAADAVRLAAALDEALLEQAALTRHRDLAAEREGQLTAQLRELGAALVLAQDGAAEAAGAEALTADRARGLEQQLSDLRAVAGADRDRLRQLHAGLPRQVDAGASEQLVEAPGGGSVALDEALDGSEPAGPEEFHGKVPDWQQMRRPGPARIPAQQDVGHDRELDDRSATAEPVAVPERGAPFIVRDVLPTFGAGRPSFRRRS